MGPRIKDENDEAYLKPGFSPWSVGASALQGILSLHGLPWKKKTKKQELVQLVQENILSKANPIPAKAGPQIVDYLLPSFDPNSLTIWRLSALMDQHEISYKLPPSKKQLVQLAQEHFLSKPNPFSACIGPQWVDYLLPSFDPYSVTTKRIIEILKEHNIIKKTVRMRKEELAYIFEQELRPKVPEIFCERAYAHGGNDPYGHALALSGYTNSPSRYVQAPSGSAQAPSGSAQAPSRYAHPSGNAYVLSGQPPSGDACIQSEYAQAPSEDAYIQSEYAQTLSGDAYIQSEYAQASSWDAYIQSEYAQAPSEDAYIQSEYAQALSGDAYIQSEYAQAPSGDAYIQSEYAQAPSANTNIQLSDEGTIPDFDAWLERMGNGLI